MVKDERPTNSTAVMPAAPLVRCPACHADAVVVIKPAQQPRRYRWLKALLTCGYSRHIAGGDREDRLRTGECQACEFAFHFPGTTTTDDRGSLSSTSRRGSDILESDRRQRAIEPLRPPSTAWIVRTGWTPQPDLLELMQRVWCAECGVFVDKKDATSNGCCGQCGASLRT